MSKLHILIIVFITPFLTQCVDEGKVNKKPVRKKEEKTTTKSDEGSPTQNPAPQDPITPTPPVNGLIMLSGSHIPSAYAAGCTPGTYNDFLDTIAWAKRRVEPRDCGIVVTANPVFSWVMPSDIDNKVPMILTLTNLSTMAVENIQVTNRARLIYPNILPNGQYKWSVKYTSVRHSVVSSLERRFSVQSNGLKIPTGQELLNLVQMKSHPRALPSGHTFSTLVSRIEGSDYRQSYQGFINRANALLLTAITPVPENLSRNDFGSELEYTNWQSRLRAQTITERSAIEVLGFAYYFTNNVAYQANAINRLIALSDWPVDGVTSEAVQDQANREIYLALGMGLDLFQNKLTSSQRMEIVATLKNRLNQVMSKYPALDKNPYDSHLLTAILYTTEALMYAVGTPEFPEARDLLMKSWDVMITNSGSWGGHDGAYGQGGAYGWYSLTVIARTLAAVKLLSGVDLHKWPVFGNFGYNQIAFYPANARLMGQFGDGVEYDRHYSDYAYDFIRLMASATGNLDYEWYWRANPHSVTYAGALSPYHYLLLGTRASNPVAPPSNHSVANSFLFEDAGLVAIHTKTTDPLRSSVFFRSSRLGSYNHSHADNNAFTFVSRGKDLLVSGGYYPYYNSPHHALVNRATRFKNALTFDGGIGQSEPNLNPTSPGKPVIFTMDGRGKLLNFKDDGTWAFTTGDATLSYRGHNSSTGAWAPLLSNAVRSLAYNRAKGIVVVYDWATSDVARNWELNFQSINPTALVAAGGLGQSLKIVNGSSSACINVFGPHGSYKYTTGFPIIPEISFPSQAQTRYNFSTPSKELAAVTIIREDCKDLPVNVTFSGRAAKIEVDGKLIEANGRILQYGP